MKKALIIIIAVVVVAALAVGAYIIFRPKPTLDPYANAPNPVATITMTGGDVMRAELLREFAPNTVANFISLANIGYYNGLSFYRVVAGCLIQTGDPNEDGTGGANYEIAGEFASNGFTKNTLSHRRGVLSMARRESDPDSAGSQFFILQGSFPEFDGEYAAFGKLMDEESLQTLDKIAGVLVDGNYRPLATQRISRITVDTFGYDYPVKRIGEED